ncbi:MAG: class I SAM-dependent methyltransferase [Nannocystaceae bacterium]|nr:class I SAM-dependent methyltransferase [bacterium]
MATEAEPGRVIDHYRARVWGGPPRAELVERDDGSIRRIDADAERNRLEAKLQALRAALRVGDTLSPSVLEVGCRQGAFVEAALARYRSLRVTALEPWLPWRDAAASRGVAVQASTVESMDAGGFDIIAEFDLLDHFAAPAEHLRALRQRLAPGGHILLGVSNVVECAGSTFPHKLRLDTPVGFTRAALRRVCAAAGLSAAIWEDGRSLFAVCERGDPVVHDVSADAASSLIRRLRENDGRLLFKRFLADRGPTPAALRAAVKVAEGCRTEAGHRALCVSVAAACERAGDHDEAARWRERGRTLPAWASQNVA